MKDLTLDIVSFDNSSTDQIDVFLLVVKLDPRPLTLKHDLFHIRNLFGVKALKSVILLPIVHSSDKPVTPKLFEACMRGESFANIVEILE